jgi:probable HAF family extracellular repeat protein
MKTDTLDSVRRRAHVACWLCLILANLTTFAAHGAARYTIINLGFVPSKPESGDDNASSGASSINNLGQIAGVDAHDWGQNVFVWEDNVLKELAGIPAGSLPGASDINNFGQIVGSYITDSAHCFIYSPSGGLNDIGGDGDPLCTPYTISDSGQIVGTSGFAGIAGTNAIAWSHGFYWDATNHFQWLSNFYNATDINSSGQIIGTSSNYIALLWDRVHPQVSIGKFAADHISWGHAINDKGVVVAFSGKTNKTTGTAYTPFLWSNGVMTALAPAVISYNLNARINNKGQVIWSWTSGTGDQAFLWQNGAATNVSSLIDPSSGWVIRSAAAINDQGCIVGSGIYNGLYRGYVMIPKPTNAVPAVLTESTMSADQNFAIKLEGTPGKQYQIESSTNLINWVQRTNSIIGPSGAMNISIAVSTPNQFYRASVTAP